MAELKDCTVWDLSWELHERKHLASVLFLDEDIIAAFNEVKKRDPTPEEVDEFWKKHRKWMQDYMIECGWDYIYNNI